MEGAPGPDKLERLGEPLRVLIKKPSRERAQARAIILTVNKDLRTECIGGRRDWSRPQARGYHLEDRRVMLRHQCSDLNSGRPERFRWAS